MVTVIGKSGNLMNVRPEEETCKILASAALMVKPLERKAIRRKLREENKGIMNEKRYPKYWRQSKVTGFIFDMVEVQEVETLVKNGMK